jgi:hypothetical protein
LASGRLSSVLALEVALGFNLLYTLIIVRLDRRHLIWVNVTTNPTADWIARQLSEAFPWNGSRSDHDS